MIRALTFSRDRAMQLHAALTSFRLHVSDAASADMVVLYRATSARHATQYQELAEHFGSWVRFVEELDFRGQILDILNGQPIASTGPSSRNVGEDHAEGHCLVLVDDCIFVRPIRLVDVQAALESVPEALGFSLRLGRNTTYCYSLSRPQALPRFNELDAGLLKYTWRHADGDFGYPLEISSSLYNLEMLRGLISHIQFENPSALESQMAVRARHFSQRQPALLCCAISVAFCTPLNRVQDVYRNRAGATSRFSVENLADLFDRGIRINVHALTGFTPRACHQEVELEFEPADEHKHAG